VWTVETEKAIQKNKLSEYYDRSNEQIKDLVEQVRGKLS